MTIQDVADRLGISKKKAWKAVKDGTLRSEKQRKGKAWRYFISEEAFEDYRQILTESGEWETVVPRETNPEETGNDSPAPSGNVGEPLKEILDRLEQAQRRAIVLELQLQQTQRLLCENNESQHEREARAKQAEERVKEREEENAQLRAELESLRTDLATKEAEWSEQRRPWWKRMWGKSS
mgnify:CR=1 FL=1